MSDELDKLPIGSQPENTQSAEVDQMQEGAEVTADGMKTSEIAEETQLPELPEGLSYDADGRIFDVEGNEYDANFDLKLPGVFYGADNKPLDFQDPNVRKLVALDEHNAPGGSILPGGPIPVKFTETRKDNEGKDFTYQYPEIRKDGKLMTHILTSGHQLVQKLVNCLFEDGTTKHVALQELHDSGLNFNLPEEIK